jgi:hypothetical protein
MKENTPMPSNNIHNKHVSVDSLHIEIEITVSTLVSFSIPNPVRNRQVNNNRENIRHGCIAILQLDAYFPVLMR